MSRGKTNMSASDLANFIKSHLQRNGLSVTELARQAGLTRQSLHSFLQGQIEQTRLATFSQIAEALKIHPIDLLRIFFARWPFSTNLPSDKLCHQIPGDNISFIGDITYPDFSRVKIGQSFEKTWEIRNSGSVVWENRRLVCLDNLVEVRFAQGQQLDIYHYGLISLSGPVITLPLIRPQESYRVSIPFLAPQTPCTTISWWKMQDIHGHCCFPHTSGLYCLVDVVDETLTNA